VNGGDRGRKGTADRVDTGEAVSALAQTGAACPTALSFCRSGLCQRAGRLVNEAGRGGPFMDLPQLFVAQLDGSCVIILS